MDGGERQALRTWFAAHGATEEQIDRFEAQCHLPRLASELVLSHGETLTAQDLADVANVEPKDVVTMFQRFGVVVDPDARQFTEADVRLSMGLCQAGHDLALGDLSRVVASAMDRLAEAAVALYVQGPEAELLEAGADAVELAEKTAAATALALDLGAGLGVLFRHHMRQAIARQRISTEGVSRRELARLAIGFVDLVNSTTMTSGLEVAELAELVSRFESRAFEIISAAGGRLVKFIGDEIMVSALDPVAGCRIVSALVAAFSADGLRPRGGLVFGEVLYRHGDYYGPVVNLAARLVNEAIPGEVLVDRAVVEALDGSTPASEPRAFEPAGRRVLKGFDEPVAVWTLARRP